MGNYILSEGYMAPVWLILAGNFVSRAYYELKQVKEDKMKIVAVIFDSASALITGGMALSCAWNGLEKLLSQ